MLEVVVLLFVFLLELFVSLFLFIYVLLLLLTEVFLVVLLAMTSCSSLCTIFLIFLMTSGVSLEGSRLCCRVFERS